MRAPVNGFLFCILLIRYPAVINVHTRCSLVSLGGFVRCTGLFKLSKMECFIRFWPAGLDG